MAKPFVYNLLCQLIHRPKTEMSDNRLQMAAVQFMRTGFDILARKKRFNRYSDVFATNRQPGT